MFQSVRHKRLQQRSPVAVDMAPLIDMVFILLIFFLVSSTFARDTGIEVSRPQTVSSQRLDPSSYRISVSASGIAYSEGEELSLAEVQRRVEKFLNRDPGGSVVVIPDEDTRSAHLLSVIDAAKSAGAEAIAIATQRTAGVR